MEDIDAKTYAEARPDIRVIDGQISTLIQGSIVSRLVVKETGINTAAEDVSLIVDDNYTGHTNKWSMEAHALT